MTRLPTRTWPYGTCKEIIVAEVVVKGRYTGLICVDAGEGPAREGYVCLYQQGEHQNVRKGDRGTLTFTKGGPTGAHWAYTPAAKEQTDVVS